MSAREMFEELGYEKPFYEKDHTVHYTKLLYRDESGFFAKFNKIIFVKRNKKVELSGEFNFEELQAINQQVKELGWVDE